MEWAWPVGFMCGWLILAFSISQPARRIYRAKRELAAAKHAVSFCFQAAATCSPQERNQAAKQLAIAERRMSWYYGTGRR